jgi:dephospho-CoA kinase
MYSVGLTGGIGSGKSIIAEYFSILKVPVYNSDIQAKILMEENSSIRKQIQVLLGHEAYINNKPNKPFIANIIFTNESLKNSLNEIVHRIVLQNYVNWINNLNAKYVIQEAAILFETGHYKKHDFMITVTCPLEIRKKRLLDKGMKLEDINQRINNQWTDEERNRLADFIIVNNEKESIIKQVSIIHDKILSL